MIGDVNSLTQSKAWEELAAHHKKVGKLHLRELIAKNLNRGERMTAEAAGLFMVMTVKRGFGHQHFLHSTLAKIRRPRQIIKQIKPERNLEVDGGIDPETAPLTVTASANVLVAEASIFRDSQGVAAAMKRLKTAVATRRMKQKDRRSRL